MATRTDTAATTIMTDSATSADLPLLVWLSPGFPVGAFAYSQGLEWAVEAGDVDDRATLARWLDDLLAHGAIRADAVLLAAAYRAADVATALETNALSLALAPSRERLLETGSQGTAFLAAVRAAWPAPAIERFADALGQTDANNGAEAAYPVAVAVAAAAHGLPLGATLRAFVLACVSNLVSAALRLGPIGQSEAQATIARLCPAIAALAAWAETADLGEIGTCAWRADIASMRHETQYSRLFRS
jgi:urease accessory protein